MKTQKPSSPETEESVIAAILAARTQDESLHIVRSSLAVTGSIIDLMTDDRRKTMISVLVEMANADQDTRTQSVIENLKSRSSDERHGSDRRSSRPISEAGTLADWIGLEWIMHLASLYAPAETHLENIATLSKLHRRRQAIDAMRDAASRLQHEPSTASPHDLIAPLRDRLRTLSEMDEADDGAIDLATWVEKSEAGTVRAIVTPWPWLQKMSAMTRPGSLVVLAADPGTGKSIMAQRAVLHAQGAGIKCACLMLEESKTYWMARAMAMMSNDSTLCDPDQIASRPADARNAMMAHGEALRVYGQSVTTCPAAGITFAQIATWAEGQAIAGARLILVDPLAVAQPSKPFDLVRETDAAVAALKRTAQRHGAVVIAITHPRKGDPRRNGNEPLMDDLAGSAGLSRFADCVVWIKASDGACSIVDESGEVRDAVANRRAKILKSRNGKGGGVSIGLFFDGHSMDLSEVGVLAPEAATKAKAKARAKEVPAKATASGLF